MNISLLKPSEREFFAKWTISTRYEEDTSSYVSSLTYEGLAVVSEFYHNVESASPLTAFVEFAQLILEDPELFEHVHGVLHADALRQLINFA